MSTLVAAVAPLFRTGPEEGPGLSSHPMDRVAGALAVAAAALASRAGAEDIQVAEECLRVAVSPQVAAPAQAVAAGITNHCRLAMADCRLMNIDYQLGSADLRS